MLWCRAGAGSPGQLTLGSESTGSVGGLLIRHSYVGKVGRMGHDKVGSGWGGVMWDVIRWDVMRWDVMRWGMIRWGVDMEGVMRWSVGTIAIG